MSLPLISDGQVVATSWFNEARRILNAGDIAIINPKDPAYGAIGDGSGIDDTLALQAAIDAAAPGDSTGAYRGAGVAKVLYIPPGDYTFTQLNIRPGLVMIGAGVGHYGNTAGITILRQKSGTNKDAFIFTPWVFGSADNTGPLEIRNMVLRGHSGNTTGHCFSVKDSTPISGVGTNPGNPLRVQDHWLLHNVVIRGFAEHGIYAPFGAGPWYLHDVGFRDMGGYGFYVKGHPDNSDMASGAGATTNPSYSIMHLMNVSFDACISGAMKFKNLKKTNGYLGIVQLTSVKCESGEVTVLNAALNRAQASITSQALVPQRYAVTFEDCEFPVVVNGLQHMANTGTNGYPPSAAFLIEAGSASFVPNLACQGVTVRKLSSQTGTINLVEDLVNGNTPVPYQETAFWSYGPSGRFRVHQATNAPDGLELIGEYATNNSPRLFFYNRASGAGFALYLNAGRLMITTGAVPGSATGTSRWFFESTGFFKADVDNTMDIGASADSRPRNVHVGTMVTIGTSQFRSGAGSPEGVVAAPVGSFYLRTDGGAGTTMYVKESGVGNTGWVAK